MNSSGTADTAAVAAARPSTLGDPLPSVRATVRELLLATPAFQQLSPSDRRSLAEAMVKVCHAAAALIREEIESDSEARDAMRRASADQTSIAQSIPSSDAAPRTRVSTGRRPLAQAQGAGADFTPGAARQIGDVTRSTLNAVSFPRFVTELINGVFKAML